MEKELFRSEVLEARKQSWLGTVQLRTTRLAWPMAGLAMAAVALLTLVLLFGGHTRKHRVQGQLVPMAGMQTVAAPVPGVLVRRLVDEGDHVDRGQPLVEISADIDTPGANGAVAEQVAAALDLQHAQLQADLAALDASERQEAAALQAQIASLSDQLAVAKDELAVRARQAAAARDTVERIRQLREDRIASDVQIQQYEDQALDAQARRDAANRSLLDLERQLSQAQLERDELPLRIGARRSGIELALAELSQAQALNAGQRAVLVRAPGAGIVSGLLADEGQAVAERQRLLSIVPHGMELHAELWVPSRAVGSLAPGGRVAMRYEPFPFQTFGQQYGHIRSISGSALAAEEIRARMGIDPGEPVYRVLVSLDRQDVATDGEPLALRPHMRLEADLLLERRRLYQLVLDPFHRARTGGAGRTGMAGTEAP